MTHRTLRPGRPPGRAAAVLVAVLALAGCSDAPDNAPEGDVDDDLARQLDDLGITLYLPDLRDSSVGSTRYDDELPGATTSFEGMEDAEIDDSWRLFQTKASAEVRESVCNAVNSDNTGSACHDADGWAYDDYEGDTKVYVLRGDTLLTANVETEDDQPLVEETAEALLDAPEISAEDLSRH